MERGVVADMGAYGHDLEFGVFIEPAARSVDQVVALSVLAEEAGYDLVSYNDHPYSPRSLDALALMSFVAARTGRVRLAANVLSLPLRPPAVLAHAVASLDILSHGRAELGIGAGNAWDAIEAMGGRRLDPTSPPGSSSRYGSQITSVATTKPTSSTTSVIRSRCSTSSPSVTTRTLATTGSRTPLRPAGTPSKFSQRLDVGAACSFSECAITRTPSTSITSGRAAVTP
jgi:hypothetical protein